MGQTLTDRDNKDTVGIVLLNLGGPDSLYAVRPFLYNLFSDRDIIRLGPPLFQNPIARLISVLRSKKTENMYSLIGGKSPIFDITGAQAEALEKALNQKSEVRSQESEVNNYSPFTIHHSRSFKVYVGMRYWHPFIQDTVQKVVGDGIRHIIVLSLYPHYSKATTGSSILEFKRAIKESYPPTHPSPSRGEGKGGGGIKVQYIEQWYDFPPYIDALAELVSKGLSEFKEENVDILYSAHSLPEKFIHEGDPYLKHIKATITALNSSLVTRHPGLALRSGAGSSLLRWNLAFQSKSGPVKWLQPATDETIIKLAQEGVKNLFVVPISFVSDHIETLYEIDVLYKKLAENHGINLKRCPSLNTSEKFIKALKELVLKEL